MPPRRPIPPPAVKSIMMKKRDRRCAHAIAIEPATTHAPAPTTPAPTVDPSTRPKIRDRMPPIDGYTDEEQDQQRLEVESANRAAPEPRAAPAAAARCRRRR